MTDKNKKLSLLTGTLAMIAFRLGTRFANLSMSNPGKTVEELASQVVEEEMAGIKEQISALTDQPDEEISALVNGFLKRIGLPHIEVSVGAKINGEEGGEA
jgi:hypothetical protein